MVSFLLYLFETGICLSILFLVYVLFFKKETYFRFNRFYLISIIVASLLVPSIHVTMHLKNVNAIEDSIQNIGKIRSYYSYIIALSDPEATPSPYVRYQAAAFEDPFPEKEIHARKETGKSKIIPVKNQQIAGTTNINVAKCLLLIYALGLVFFLIRFIILVHHLLQLIQKNPKKKLSTYTLITLDKQTPPFSFFKYIFVNKNDLKLPEYEQILTHEKVHVMQRHSLDLFLAYGVTVFQWFNPMAWQLQKSIKTTHEYIADSKVVSLGYKLFDYQSLLLSQLVSIQSVELVNNFNLLFIKKRIKMMTKSKSGITAKLKVVTAIPAALAIFFLFANLTIKSPVFNITNFGTEKTSNLNGLWINDNNESYGKILLFEENKLSILESLQSVKVLERTIGLNTEAIIIHLGPTNSVELKYTFKNDGLQIWWNDHESSSFRKTEFSNSFQALMPSALTALDLPIAQNSRVLDQPKFIFNVYVFQDHYYVEDKKCNLKQLSEFINKRITKFNKLDKPYITAKVHVSATTAMEPVHDLIETFRDLNILKIAYAINTQGQSSKLLEHAQAIVRKLPPKGDPRMQVLERTTVKDRLFVINMDVKSKNKEAELELFIKQHPNYIIALDWSNSTSYKDYIHTLDWTYGLFMKLRDAYAMHKYDLVYMDLPEKLQASIREKYPLRITQENTDEPENNKFVLKK